MIVMGSDNFTAGVSRVVGHGDCHPYLQHQDHGLSQDNGETTETHLAPQQNL